MKKRGGLKARLGSVKDKVQAKVAASGRGRYANDFDNAENARQVSEAEAALAELHSQLRKVGKAHRTQFEKKQLEVRSAELLAQHIRLLAQEEKVEESPQSASSSDCSAEEAAAARRYVEALSQFAQLHERLNGVEGEKANAAYASVHQFAEELVNAHNQRAKPIRKQYERALTEYQLSFQKAHIKAVKGSSAINAAKYVQAAQVMERAKLVYSGTLAVWLDLLRAMQDQRELEVAADFLRTYSEQRAAIVESLSIIGEREALFEELREWREQEAKRLAHKQKERERARREEHKQYAIDRYDLLVKLLASPKMELVSVAIRSNRPHSTTLEERLIHVFDAWALSESYLQQLVSLYGRRGRPSFLSDHGSSSKMLYAYIKVHGGQYLRNTWGPFVSALHEEPEEFLIDNNDGMSRILGELTSALVRMLEEAPQFPPLFRHVVSWTAVEGNMGCHSFVFGRCVQQFLSQPHTFGLPEHVMTESVLTAAEFVLYAIRVVSRADGKGFQRLEKDRVVEQGISTRVGQAVTQYVDVLNRWREENAPLLQRLYSVLLEMEAVQKTTNNGNKQMVIEGDLQKLVQYLKDNLDLFAIGMQEEGHREAVVRLVAALAKLEVREEHIASVASPRGLFRSGSFRASRNSSMEALPEVETGRARQKKRAPLPASMMSPRNAAQSHGGEMNTLEAADHPEAEAPSLLRHSAELPRGAEKGGSSSLPPLPPRPAAARGLSSAQLASVPSMSATASGNKGSNNMKECSECGASNSRKATRCRQCSGGLKPTHQRSVSSSELPRYASEGRSASIAASEGGGSLRLSNKGRARPPLPVPPSRSASAGGISSTPTSPLHQGSKPIPPLRRRKSDQAISSRVVKPVPRPHISPRPDLNRGRSSPLPNAPSTRKTSGKGRGRGGGKVLPKPPSRAGH